MQFKETRYILTIISVCLLGATSVPPAQDAFAGEREKRWNKPEHVVRQQERKTVHVVKAGHKHYKKRFISPRITRHGHVVRRLPRGYKRVWYGGRPYFFSFGVFYRSGPSGFIVVKAPVGAVVVGLPVGYRTVWIEGSSYFVYGGVFYRRVPAGYVVVSPPATVVVEEKAPALVQPSEEASGQVSVTASILNVRTGPGIAHAVIYQIHQGYVLEVHGKTAEWLYVELPNGEFGWIMIKFTKPIEDASG